MCENESKKISFYVKGLSSQEIENLLDKLKNINFILYAGRDLTNDNYCVFIDSHMDINSAKDILQSFDVIDII